MSEPPLPPAQYQRKLYWLLGAASFFDGYDIIALSQLLPELRSEFGMSRAAGGTLLSVVNVGTVLAYILVRRADGWGRKRLLTGTLLGYTVFTLLSGLAPTVWVFGAMQLLARVFLIAEWAVSMVIAAEEFPKERRGHVLGLINGFSTLGSIVCAGLAPLLVDAFGWRSVYFVGVVPLLMVAYLRRHLRETRRFQTQGPQPMRPLLHIWRTPYRARVIHLGLLWGLVYLAANNSVSFFKDFAVNERGWTAQEVGTSISIAAVAALAPVFFVGKLIDRVGRRWGAACIFSACALGTYGSYTLQGRVELTLALTVAIFSAGAFLPVLNAFNTELFPTELRGDAMAWSNTLLGRFTYVLSPLVIGVVGNEIGYGPAVAATALAPLVAVPLVFWLLPETNQRELEETARV